MPAAVETTPQEKVSLLGGPRREVLQSITCADWWALDTTVSGRLHVLLLAYRLELVAATSCAICGVSCVAWLTLAK